MRSEWWTSSGAPAATQARSRYQRPTSCSAWSSAAGLRAALGAAGALGELGLALAVLLLGQVRELLGERGLDRLARGAAALAAPSPAAAATAARTCARASGARANASACARSAGPSREPERERLLAVAERQPRARERRGRLDAARLQPLGDRLGAQRVEAHGLAAGGDRRQHLGRAVGEQQQHDVGRRLLERLEQRVGRLVVHRVGALEHEHAPARLERRVRGGGHDGLVDVAAQHLVRAAGRDPGQVGMRAVLHPHARVVRGRPRRARAARRRRRAPRRACRCPPGRAAGRRARAALRLERGAEHGGGVRVGFEGEHARGSLDGRIPGMASIYDQIGGTAAVAAAVDGLYARVLADPALAPFFDGIPMERQQRHMRAFITVALGGAHTYAGRDMATAHAGAGHPRPRVRRRRRPPRRRAGRARRARGPDRRDPPADRPAARRDRHMLITVEGIDGAGKTTLVVGPRGGARATSRCCASRAASSCPSACARSSRTRR